MTEMCPLQSNQIRWCESMSIIGLMLLDRRACRVISGFPGWSLAIAWNSRRVHACCAL